MELKEFIKGVISDITGAVKESQDELENGVIISPLMPNNKNNERVRDSESKGYLDVSYIDFEVAVTVSEEKSTQKEASGEVKGFIKVVSAYVSGKVSAETKTDNESLSKVKFSIPLIYPCSKIN